MAKTHDLFRCDEDVAEAILDVIRTAKKEITIVSPYLNLWDEAKRAILDALRRKVTIFFALRYTRKLEHNQDLNWLEDNGIDWDAFPDLHAKIYLNEDTVLLSSMNLYAYSARHNFEVCYAVPDSASKSAIREYVDSFKEPIASCIRCGTDIEPNPYRPLCERDYRSWVRFGDWFYPEKYCFLCGKRAKTTKADPFCDDCDKYLEDSPVP